MDSDTQGPFLIKSAAEKEAEERAAEQRTDRRYHKLQLWFNGALMVAAIVTAGVVLYQNALLDDSIAEMKRTNELMATAVDVSRDQVMAAERAWVTVKLATVVDRRLSRGVRPTIQVEIQNTGHSPALNKTDVAYAGIATQLPDGDAFPFELVRTVGIAQSSARGVMGPSTPETIPVQLREDLTDLDIAALVSGKGKFIFVFGLIEYDDTFGRRHVTTFCYHTTRGYSGMSPCFKWNSAN